MEARAKRNEEAQNNKRDLELITKVFDYTNTEAWPKLQHNPDQTKVSTIITLALLDEAVNPGIFQEKLTRSCEQNNIPKVNYRPEPNTATAFYNSLCGAATQTTLAGKGKPHTAGKGKPHIAGKRKLHIISVNTGNMTQPKTSKNNNTDQHTPKRTQSILPQFKILQGQLGGKEAQKIYIEVEKLITTLKGMGH